MEIKVTCRSRPTRARGLKHPRSHLLRCLFMSRPTRARGLKLYMHKQQAFFQKSRPTRARGLKPLAACLILDISQVAPHAGAWIETRLKYRAMPQAEVAPHAGAWIETSPCR